MMKVSDFVSTLINITENYKTLYVNGCFGAPLVGSSIERYCNNTEYNRQAERTAKITAAGNQNPPVYGFDCVGLVKGVLWGWSGNPDSVYGGAVYASNKVPDIGEDSMIDLCSEVSADFNNISIGEMVWISGHMGVYVGNNLVVESTPLWKDGVQYSLLGNTGNSGRDDLPSRIWTKHGKLPYVDYSATEVTTSDEAIDWLYANSIINSPEYWKDATDVVNNLGALFVKLTNEIIKV